ncbi:NAD(P)H-binding protein [Caballeronia sp. LZ034LL]|uniref:SDR family oxidoreductase n=1 Tax=Caballeronia sp. LZ034LL TaxID=3038567 RepID=UPI002858F75A|nr:NAD(P)H-binding protein [Caballeronia sp. LZ034LL]MDR5837418.1 NAD(P)H-binding protein [Caballeronia sp. LZ034LL]
MKIVVIGGTGLIGAKAVALLREKGHEAVAASPSTGVNAITGAGLADALRGAQVVIDVTNPPTHDREAVMAFFRDATRNLLQAERDAGVQHHVVLSIVGVDRMEGNAYYAAKCVQEQLIAESGVPYSIVRATQFFEFLGTIADLSTVDGTARLSPHQFQPIAADDVTALIAEIALGAPLNGIVDIAGPEQGAMHAFIGTYLRAVRDARRVIADDKATYFGGVMKERSLVPTGTARYGRTSLGAWLDRARLKPLATA